MSLRSPASRMALGTSLTILALSLLAGPATPAEAQFGKLKEKVKRKVEQRVDQKTDRAVDQAVDAADPTTQQGDESAGDGSADTAPAATTEAARSGATAPAKQLKPGEGAWANFDFKPGERVLFADDLTRDEVGDFPRRLELREGNMEIVEWQGGRYLRATSFGGFAIPLPETLPERFTLEFDFAGPAGWRTAVYFSGSDDIHDHNYVSLDPLTGGIDGRGLRAMSAPSRDLRDKVFPVRVMADGRYVKVYMDEKRVANVPNAVLGRSDRIIIEFGASEEFPVLIGNLRVAAGGRKLYDALTEKGRVATQGIYFDIGSDRLRPESTPTLKEIGAMLKEHPELRLLIEGHTDNVGKPEANRALSERRAAAVRQFLIDTYQIDAARLEAKGFGDTKPAAPNDTPEGRQSNRRVELVKL